MQEIIKQETITKYEQKKSQNYQEEYDKIENYRADVLEDFQDKIDTISKQIKEIHNLMSQAANISEKWQYTSEIEKLRKTKRETEKQKQDKELELDIELNNLMQNYETQLEYKIDSSNLFIIKFIIV